MCRRKVAILTEGDRAEWRQVIWGTCRSLRLNMTIQIGLERNVEVARCLGSTIGVFTYGADDASDFAHAARDVRESWLNTNRLSLGAPRRVDVHIDEIFEVFPVDDEGGITRSKRLPFRPRRSARKDSKALQIYTGSVRAAGIGLPDLLSRQFEERWTIGDLDIARVEQYFSRLGLGISP